MLVGVTVKPFGVAKARLRSVLDASERSRLGMSIAARTLELASLVGRSAVVTGDAGVGEWAQALGHAVVWELPGGLDGAALALVQAAGIRPWMVLHADLPRLSPADLRAASAALDTHSAVVAPSSDGGTSLIGGSGPARFSFGAGSFQRHLASMPGAHVLVRPGLALDLDTPSDYWAWRRSEAIRTPQGDGTIGR